jgi:hypothetical protein
MNFGATMKVYKWRNCREIEVWNCDTNDPMIAIHGVQQAIANNHIINYYPVLRWKEGAVLALVTIDGRIT